LGHEGGGLSGKEQEGSSGKKKILGGIPQRNKGEEGLRTPGAAHAIVLRRSVLARKKTHTGNILTDEEKRQEEK